MPKRRPPKRLRRLLRELRDEAPYSRVPSELFAIMLEFVEFVARHEDVIFARGIDLEPDHLARRLLADSQFLGARAVNQLLSGLGRQELATLEQLLLELEIARGKATRTPAKNRILLDGAILSQVGFIYSRKFREVLSTGVLDETEPSRLLPNLLANVDRIFDGGRPAYFWRLGPEFGTDANLRHLVQRGDWFIVQSLYRSRAERAATDVVKWAELPGGCWIGEACEEQRFRSTVRSLIVRSGCDGRYEHRLLVTNLYNMPWHEIFRFYNNRSGKNSGAITREPQDLRKRLSAAMVILAIFTFRNLSTWALDTQVTLPASSIESEAPKLEVSLVQSSNQSELFDLVGNVLDYLGGLTDASGGVEAILASASPSNSYQIALENPTDIPAMAPGTVIFIDRSKDGASITIDHGKGISAVYGGLSEITPGMAVGQRVEAESLLGAFVPSESTPWFHFETRITKRYLDKSILPNVAELLLPGSSVFLDPLGLLSSYQESAEVVVGGVGKLPSLAEADLYRLSSPHLQGETIFVAQAAEELDMGVPPLEEPFDDDFFTGLPPIGEDPS